MRREHFDKLERMYAAAPVNQSFRPVLQVSEGTAFLTMPVREEHFHAAGSLHGSVYFKALDDAAFFAVNSLVEDVFVLTTSFTVYLLRPVTSGTLEAEGRVISSGRNLFVAEATLKVKGRLAARGSGAFMRSDTRLSEVEGYR